MSKHVDDHNNSELMNTILIQMQLFVKITLKCCNDKILH